MASKKAKFASFADLFQKHAAAHVAQLVNEPSPIWELFHDDPPKPEVTIPMKSMVGKITLKKGDVHPGLQGATWDANTSMKHWSCGCKTGQEPYGKVVFKCHKLGNHCYRERAGG